ncbi:MAG TPA: zf-HC2 domain-containing protein [Bryobacteraceae bacterium]|nr:zf-HC2 domain-containing protein [Bryobacteraceae bacterium]
MEFESILADYFDGTLSNAGRASVEQHAASCANCREFMAETRSGLAFLERAEEVEPPSELITRIAYLAPRGRTREPFERQSLFGKLRQRWLTPILQPRLAMGMAMTILSFAMLERCTGIHVQHLEPSDLNPVRVWSGVEDKGLRVRDQAVKYYNSLRIVYEVETRLRDLEDQDQNAPASTKAKSKSTASTAAGMRGSRPAQPRNEPSPNRGDKP